MKQINFTFTFILLFAAPIWGQDMDRQAEIAETLGLSQDQKALQQLAILEAKYKGTRLEAQIQVNKADLYLRRARSTRILDYVAGQRTQGNFTSKENDALLAALNILLKVEFRFPEYQGMDRVKLRVARIFEKLKKPALAQKYYLKVISEHKQSLLVLEAKLSLADSLFHQKKFEEALRRYNDVVSQEGPYKPQATYMKAWCFYNLRQPQNGLMSLKEVIGSGGIISTLVSEALSDVPLFFAEFGDAKSATQVLTGVVGSNHLSQVLNELSEIFRRYNRKSDADHIDYQLTQLEGVSNEKLYGFKRRVELALEHQNYTKAKILSDDFVAYCEANAQACGAKKSVVIGEWLKQSIKSFEKKPTPALAEFILAEFNAAQDSKLQREHASFLFNQKRYTESYKVYRELFNAESTTDDLFGALASLDRSINKECTVEQYKEFKFLSQQLSRRESTARSHQAEVRLVLLAKKMDDDETSKSLTRKLASSNSLDGDDKTVIQKLDEQDKFKHALKIADKNPVAAKGIFLSLAGETGDSELAIECRLNALILSRKSGDLEQGMKLINELRPIPSIRKQYISELKNWAVEFHQRFMWLELKGVLKDLQDLDVSTKDEWANQQKVIAKLLEPDMPESLKKASAVTAEIKKMGSQDLEKIMGRIKKLQILNTEITNAKDPVWTIRSGHFLAEAYEHMSAVVAAFPDEDIAAQATNFSQQAAMVRSDLRKLAEQFAPHKNSKMSGDELLVVEFSPDERAFNTKVFPQRAEKLKHRNCQIPKTSAVRAVLDALPACVAQQKWNEVEALALSLAKQDPALPWSAYYLSLVAESKSNMHLARWYLEKARSLKNYDVFEHQTARLKKKLIESGGVPI